MQQRGIRPAALEAILDFGRTAHVDHGREIVFFDKAARARLARQNPVMAKEAERLRRTYAIAHGGAGAERAGGDAVMITLLILAISIVLSLTSVVLGSFAVALAVAALRPAPTACLAATRRPGWFALAGRAFPGLGRSRWLEDHLGWLERGRRYGGPPGSRCDGVRPRRAGRLLAGHTGVPACRGWLSAGRFRPARARRG